LLPGFSGNRHGHYGLEPSLLGDDHHQGQFGKGENGRGQSGKKYENQVVIMIFIDIVCSEKILEIL